MRCLDGQAAEMGVQIVVRTQDFRQLASAFRNRHHTLHLSSTASRKARRKCRKWPLPSGKKAKKDKATTSLTLPSKAKISWRELFCLRLLDDLALFFLCRWRLVAVDCGSNQPRNRRY